MTVYVGTDGLRYESVYGTLTVTGTGAMNSLRQGVLSISGGSAIDLKNVVETFVVSNGITNVCPEAFSTYLTSSQNQTLKSVSLASTVVSIGNSAFHGCIALEAVNISATSITVGSNSFDWCSSLTEFPLEKTTSIGQYAFANCTRLTSSKISTSWTSIPAGAFEYCASITRVKVPSNINGIGVQAFMGCTGLTSVTIEYHTQTLSVNESAFSGCTSLETLRFLTGGTGTAKVQLGSSCFSNCTTLKRVNLPAGVTLSAQTFTNCTSLELMVFSPSQSAIPSQVCLGCTALSIVCIPDGYRSISNYAFYGCTALRTVLIGSCANDTSAINISQAAFEGCTALEEVRFGAGTLYFDKYIFRGCTALKKLVFIDSSALTFSYQTFMCGMVYDESTQTWVPAPTTPEVQITSNDSSFVITGQDYVTFQYDTYGQNAQVYSVHADVVTGYDVDTPIYPSPSIQLSIGAPGQDGGIDEDTLILMDSGFLRSPVSKQVIPSVLIYQEGGDTRVSVNLELDRDPIDDGMPALYDYMNLGSTLQTSDYAVKDYDILSADLVTLQGKTVLNLAIEMEKAIRVVYETDPEFPPEDQSLSINVEDGYYSFASVQSGKTIVLPSVNPDGPYGIVEWFCPDTGEECPLGGYALLDPNAPRGVQTLYGRWGLLFRDDELAAMIIFSPGGGTFNRATGAVQFALEEGEEPVGHISYDPLKELWVWWAESLDRSEDIRIRFRMPISNDTGLTVPEGMEYVQSWYVSAPYFNGVPDAGRVIEYVIRETSLQDTQIRRTFYPLWYPARRSVQTILLVTPGYGTIDLGYIQSITETYNATLTTIPIVCYGYSGTFCMDTGVEKDISVDFTRTSLPLPSDPAHPTKYECDDSSADSKRWTNAKWVSFLKTLMDRWQMMTNGSLLYLLRPSSERLMTDTDPSAVDPMSELYTEIIGEHCYITQVPVVYSNTPQTISGNISLSIGTIYPKSPEAEMIKVKFYGLANQDPVIRKYPLSSLFLLPDPVEIWGTSMITDTTQVIAWMKNDSDTLYDFKSLQQMNTFLMPGTTNDYRVYAKTEEMTDTSYELFTSNGTATVIPTPGERCIVSITAVGGGGGGGGASIPDFKSGMIRTSPRSTITHGGGGGGSGIQKTWSLTISTPIELDILIGTGGSGGVSGYYDADNQGNKDGYHHASNGISGGPTQVTVRTQTETLAPYTAPGGVGGHSGEDGGGGGSGFADGGDGGKGDTDRGTAGADGSDIGSGGEGGYGYDSSDDGTYINGAASGGGGGAGGYLPDSRTVTAGDMQRLNGAVGSNGQGSGPDGDDSDDTVAGRGGGGGGGGGKADYSNGGAFWESHALWGIKAYPGKPGGSGWALIRVSGGTIDV